MQSGSNGGRQTSMISDTDLLRTIGQDLRAIYAEVIKQPLPRNIEAALLRIDREQTRAGYQSQQMAL
jgi:hypothetical protein